MNTQWLQPYRQLLDDILDQLIPANAAKSIPSAGSFGVGDFIVARATDDRAFSDALRELLSLAEEIGGDVNPELVGQLESRCDESFRVLLSSTYMGYYSRPEIRSLLGLSAEPVHPKGYDVPIEPIDMIEKLTAPVTQRGSIYRDPGKELQES